jgi:hypothetical protein
VDIPDLEPSVEVAHLRRLLDIQPACLMRLGADGTVLAANDAALAMLGVKSGAQALGRDFSAWVPEDQCDRWKAFSGSVARGCPSSVECDIAAPHGDRQPTLFHGVPLADHPDGAASIAVAARAVSGQRHVEAAVVRLEEQLRQRTADLGERDLALAEADAARRTAEANCARALADVRQLEVALEGFAARQQQTSAERAAERQRGLEMFESAAAKHQQELAAARRGPEADRLAARLEEREATIRGLEGAWLAAQAELDEVRGVHQQLDTDLKEAQRALARSEERARDLLADRDELRTRLDEALVTCREREAAMRELETAHGTLAAAHSAATAEHERFVSALREHAVRLDALANGFPCAGGGEAAAQGSAAPGIGREDGPA